MAIPTVNIVLPNGAVIPLVAGKKTMLPPATAVKLVVTSAVKGQIVNAFDFTGREPLALVPKGTSWATQPPYEIAWTTPASGSAVVGVKVDQKVNAKREQVGETGKFEVRFAAATPPVVSQPEPKPGKETPEEETPTPASSKVIKGIVTDHLFAGDTVIILRDGKRTTHREYFGLCGHEVARLWNGVAPDEEPSAAWLNERIAWAKDNGVETLILCCTPEDGGRVKPTAAKTKAYFEKLVKLLTACGFDVAVELVNEPNLDHYWAWSLAELVTLFLNPAIEVLAAAGIEIIGPSPTGEVKPVRDLITAGLNTKKLSGMGFHLYRQSGPAAKAMLADLAGVVGTLPIDHTELNAFVGANVRAWKVLQSRPELTKAKLGRDVIDADVRKFDDRARLPARSPADAVAIQKAIWAEVVACPNSRYACYYVLYLEKETSTGPLSLLVKGKDGLLYETEYSADFWRLAKVSGK